MVRRCGAADHSLAVGSRCVGWWVVRMPDYGIRVLRQGVDLRQDQRPRDLKGRVFSISSASRRSSRRGTVGGFSPASAKRLEFLTANLGSELRSILTLTYHAVDGEWESDGERNCEIAQRSKADLNRFLSCLRKRLGQYLWVQEFQARGVIHYHVLCEHVVSEADVRVVWCRAVDQLRDEAALRHGVKVEVIRSEVGARWYLGRYLGKGHQKQLPVGVEGAGRWWGRSRGLDLAVIEEIVSARRRDQKHSGLGVFVLRRVRRFLSGVFGRKFRGGLFVNWGGELAARVARVVAESRDWLTREAEAWVGQLHPSKWESGGEWDGQGIRRVDWGDPAVANGGASEPGEESANDRVRRRWREDFKRRNQRRASKRRQPSPCRRAREERLAAEAERSRGLSRSEHEEDSAHGSGGDAPPLSESGDGRKVRGTRRPAARFGLLKKGG